MINYMLSGYPRLDMDNPQDYLAALISIATLFDEETINQVVEMGFKYPPNRFEWRQALDERAEAIWRLRKHQYVGAREIDLPRITHEEARARYAPDPEPDPVSGKHPVGTVLHEYGRWLGTYGRPRERP